MAILRADLRSNTVAYVLVKLMYLPLIVGVTLGPLLLLIAAFAHGATMASTFSFAMPVFCSITALMVNSSIDNRVVKPKSRRAAPILAALTAAGALAGAAGAVIADPKLKLLVISALPLLCTVWTTLVAYAVTHEGCTLERFVVPVVSHGLVSQSPQASQP